jgi:hypothetical protein
MLIKLLRFGAGDDDEALMMEAASTSETLLNFYQTTQRCNPKDSHLRTNRREKLKSYLIFLVHLFKAKW